MHKVEDGDQLRKDQTDDKQCQWHQREIKVKGQKFDSTARFKYLGTAVSDDGSKTEILSRIVQGTAALTKLKPICRETTIDLLDERRS